MDRFYRGLFAGVGAGIPMNLWSIIAHSAGFGRLRYLDWAGVIIYGAPPQTLAEMAYAQLIQLIWVGLLGVLFAYLVPVISAQGLLGKGMFFAMVSGLFIYAVPVLLQVPQLSTLDFATVLNNHIGGLIWAVVLVWILRRLEPN